MNVPRMTHFLRLLRPVRARQNLRKKASSIILALFDALFLLSAGTFAYASDKVALVIGNSAYPEKPLTNPVNDAADVAAALRKLGFDVIETSDLDKRGIERRSREFRAKLQKASLALLYYAGHGMQVDGRNYILPIDAKIDSAEDVKLEAVDLDAIMQQMRGPERVSIIIMDACRDNPFAKTLAGPATRATKNPFGGLAEIKSSLGTIIVFATDPGNVASDGDGRNSPFSRALLNHIHEPGLDFGRLMMKVRFDVIRATESRQVPWENSSLIRPIYLAGEPVEQPIQQASLAPGNSAQARSLAQTREGGPQRAPAPNTPAKPANTDGEMCDRLATSQLDPLRRKDVPPVKNVDWERAIPACEKAVAASPGVLRYANQLGRAYLAARREEDAVRIYRDAAERGAAFATADMGFLYYRGWGGVARDYKAALLWSEKGARLGVPMAMTNVAYIVGKGIGVPRDQAAARQWYTRALAMNEPSTLVSVAQAYNEGWGGEIDSAKAREILVKAAATEEPTALTALGFYHQFGIAGPRDFEEARRLFDRAAAAGDAAAMGHIGAMFREGNGGFPRDYQRAREWFERAVRLNHSSGHLGLALLYAYGEGVEKDFALARKHLEQAARHDDVVSIRILAQWLEEGIFGQPDKVEARKWLQRGVDTDDELSREQLARLDRPETSGEACDRLAARQTDPLRPANVKPPLSLNTAKGIPACEAAVRENPDMLRYQNQLGVLYIQDDRYGDALRVFETAAGKGAAYAALWVGNIHARGLSVAKNSTLGADWFEKAAQLGSPDAMFNLALALQQGDGVKIGHPLARRWYEEAAEAGHGLSMRMLGRTYYNGTGVRRDYVQARIWLEKAAAKDDAEAMRLLGDIYENGRGIVRNYALARQWYAQAAAANDTRAMQSLAQLYISGFGGAREMEKAKGLLEQAAGADVPEAMVTLAQALLAGAFGETDEPGARRWVEKAAAAGNSVAKSMLTSMTGAAMTDAAAGETCDRTAGDNDDPLRSVVVPAAAQVDTAKAVAACEQALARSPNTLRYANQLGRAYVASSRYFDAMRVFRLAAEKGSAFAQLWVGNLYDRGRGVPRDPAQAAQWYEKAAENGFAIAMYNLGAHFRERASSAKGEDQKKFYTQAREWYQRGSEVGHPDSMWAIAKFYEHGLGVEVDRKLQFEWLEKASDFGSDSARNDLAVAYINGDGLSKNHGRAVELLEVIVSNGKIIQAEVNLAHLLLFGDGVTRDLQRARKLLETSASKQNVGAIVYLAEALNAGTFGQRELPEARRLLQLASGLGSAKAKELLAKMK